MSQPRRKRDRNYDLPAFSGKIWRQRHERATARADGWTEKVTQLGLAGSADDAAALVFEAYAAARQRWHRWRLDRPEKLAEIQAGRSMLDAVIALHNKWQVASAQLPSVEEAKSIVGFRARARFVRNEIWPAVINRALCSDRARLDELAALFDGRGHSTTRLRFFAEELLPLFINIFPAERQSRPSFVVFLGACCEVVLGIQPGIGFLREVARPVFK